MKLAGEILAAWMPAPGNDGMGRTLGRSTRTRRPRHADIDWNRTIRTNLRQYQPELGTVVLERLVGYGRRICLNPR